MDEKRKYIRLFVILSSILIIGLIIFTFSLYIQSRYHSLDKFIDHLSTRRVNLEVDDGLDAARQEFKESLETASVYEIKDGDFIESVSVTDVYDDWHFDSENWLYVDKIVVTVNMKESFNKDFLIQDKCQMFVSIREEISPYLKDLYYASSYYQLFDKYKTGKPGYEELYFCGRLLSLDYYISYIFYDGVYEYELGYDSVGVVINDNVKKIYSFRVNNGQIINFRDLYREGVVDIHGNLIQSNSNSSASSSAASSGKKDTTTSGGSSYDPYDVHDYDSADDFADDKYEEFYDSEDEYEDEDEAYDAAEDYWYDEY
jgi:hypothetical protein